jgi:hypothetical protein
MPIPAVPTIVLRVTFDFSDIVDAALMNARQLLQLNAVSKTHQRVLERQKGSRLGA